MSYQAIMSEARAIVHDLEELGKRVTAIARRVEALQTEDADSLDTTSSRLLTCAQVVERTGLSRGAVYRLAREGGLGVVRAGERGVQFSERGLEQWLRQGGSRCS